GSDGIEKILKAEDNESVAQVMVNTKIFTQVEGVYDKLKDFRNNYVMDNYSTVDFDTSDPENIKAFENEIKRFIFARKGNFQEDITGLFTEVKNTDTLEILKKSDTATILSEFNKYTEDYGENPVSEDELISFFREGNNSFISEYMEYYCYENEAKIKSDYVYSYLRDMNTGLKDNDLHELSNYVNDTEVPVPGNDSQLQVKITGIPILANKVNDMIFDNQTKSMILAYIFVFIIFAIQMKSAFIGLLSLIPITLTILANFGIMGITGISLNAATVTIASITIGAGIDYTIHYITRFKKEYKESGNKSEAAVKTSATSGKAIIINSLAVVLGFVTFIFSDIGMLKQFGILTASAMVI
ncbi:MAG TPA: MMPL family transporter, partial [Tepiditoga sp.]|nr:MMPL family transporter [Tepiditoga sp.]